MFQPGQRHRGPGDRLVTADEHSKGRRAVAPRHELDRIGNHLAADSEARIPSVPIVMPSEIDTVLNLGVPPWAQCRPSRERPIRR
jgi:hypothetical protein